MKNVFISITVAVIVLFCADNSVAQKYLPKSKGEIVRHTYYILSYLEEHEQAEWVYYELTPEMIKSKAVRKNNFKQDPKVSNKSAEYSDYTNSGYDRGHLCPAASMKHTQQAMDETFYMSNISPQLPAFNRGIWKKLEEKVREWVITDSVLIVITGAILPTDTTTNKLKTIGKNKVSVPTHFYKIIYSPKRKTKIGYIIPNKKSNKPIESYALPIDSIEQRTYIDFYPYRTDALNNQP